MADYRGGEMRMSEYGQQAAKALREGRTEGQRKRDFTRKLLITGVQMGLAGASGIASANHREGERNKRKRAMADAELMSSTEKYRAPDYTGPKGDVPEWLGARGSHGNTDMLQRQEPKQAPDWAHQGKSLEQRASEALEGQPSGPPAADPFLKAQEEEEAHKSLARRQTGIHPVGGGMMGSLPRRSR